MFKSLNNSNIDCFRNRIKYSFFFYLFWIDDFDKENWFQVESPSYQKKMIKNGKIEARIEWKTIRGAILFWVVLGKKVEKIVFFSQKIQGKSKKSLENPFFFPPLNFSSFIKKKNLA